MCIKRVETIKNNKNNSACISFKSILQMTKKNNKLSYFHATSCSCTQNHIPNAGKEKSCKFSLRNKTCGMDWIRCGRLHIFCGFCQNINLVTFQLRQTITDIVHKYLIRKLTIIICDEITELRIPIKNYSSLL